jgi:hypothetical protein
MAVQRSNDINTRRDSDVIRRKLGARDESGPEGIQWTELHDALTSMRAHDKRIPSNLTSVDLDLIDAQVGSLLALFGHSVARVRKERQQYVFHAVLPGLGSAGGIPASIYTFQSRSLCQFRLQASSCASWLMIRIFSPSAWVLCYMRCLKRCTRVRMVVSAMIDKAMMTAHPSRCCAFTLATTPP